MQNSIPSWLANLESKAAKDLKGKTDGWPDDGYACAWLRWYFSLNHGKTPSIVFVLQDWGLADDESLAEAMKLLNKGEGDRTIKAVFEHSQLKAKIKTGEVCVMNAVWGLRNTKNKTGYLGTEIHAAAFPIWATALKNLSPAKVCLCGEWAKWPKVDWGVGEEGPCQIARWIRWSRCSSTVAFKAGDFVKQKFYTIPHPSAWTFDFSNFVDDLKL